MKNKKLQVFISSTFIDLIEERQAAVQAVLSCGHIPAGMELFTAGDESQMKVIKRWIEESDVYLLILGGRYGSIESVTGKSYTQLEYEYAISLGKPFFAVVISDEANEAKIKEKGSDAFEKINPQKLAEFRKEVTAKMVKFFDDNKDIKLAVHETISEFERRKELIGWVRASEDVDTGNLAEELARLAKENSDLRKQLSEIKDKDQLQSIGISIYELEQLLKSEKIKPEEVGEEYIDEINEFREKLGDEDLNLLHFLWIRKDDLAKGEFEYQTKFDEFIYNLVKFGLVVQNMHNGKYSLTDVGRALHLKYVMKFGAK
jgi:hypothetical protein